MFELQRKLIFRPPRLSPILTQNITHFVFVLLFLYPQPEYCPKKVIFELYTFSTSVCAFLSFKFEPKRTKIHSQRIKTPTNLVHKTSFASIFHCLLY